MQDVIEKKKFIFGVNYWASKNSIKMWKNWNADDVRADLTALKSVGVDFIRISLHGMIFSLLNALKETASKKSEYATQTTHRFPILLKGVPVLILK